MEAEDTDFEDVEDLVFKEKENVSIGPGFGTIESPIGNLVVVSNKYGFVIAAIRKGLRFIRSQALHKKSSDHGSTVQIPLEDNATSIGLASDHLTLSIVVNNSTKVLLYDTSKVASRDVTSFASPDFNSEVEDLRWHVTDPNTFAVKLADGRIIEYNIATDTQTSVATLRDVMSIAWHPAQNTLACLLEDGKIEVFTKSGSKYEARRALPALESDGNEAADASYIRWLDDNLIGVGYSLSENEVAFLMITLKGDDDYEALKMLAPTDIENPSFSTAYIKEWKTLLWTTTGAQDIEVMSCDDAGKWFTCTLMDDARPNVPMDNYIIGMSFDYTNTVQLKKGEDTFFPVSPILVFITHEGRLCTFDFVNKACKDPAPFMVTSVPALPAPKTRGSASGNSSTSGVASSPSNTNALPTSGAPKTSAGGFGFGDSSNFGFPNPSGSNSFSFGPSPTAAPSSSATPSGPSGSTTTAPTSGSNSFNFGFGTPTNFDTSSKPAVGTNNIPAASAPKTGLSSSNSNTFSFGPSPTDGSKKDDKKDSNPFGFGSSTSFGFGDTVPKPSTATTENKPATATPFGSSGSAFSLNSDAPTSVNSPSVQRRAQPDKQAPTTAPVTDFGFGSGPTSFSFDTKPKVPASNTGTSAPPRQPSQPSFAAPAPKQSPPQQQATAPQTQPAPIKLNLVSSSGTIPPPTQGPSATQNAAQQRPGQPSQPQPVQGQQPAKPKQGITAQELISRPINAERGIEQQFMEQIAIFNEAMRRAHGWVADTVSKIRAIQQGAKLPEKKLPFTEAELTQLCSATSDVMAKVDADNVDLEALKRQVDALKINFLDAFAFAQEASSLIMASQDESYQHLLDSRNLDPESQDTRKKLKKLINEVDSSVKQVEQYLDSFMIKRGKRDDKTFKVPTLASLYGTLRSHYEIVATQKQKIKELSDAFNKIQLRLVAEGRPVPSAAWDDLKKVQSAQKVKKISRTLQTKPQFSYNPTSLMAAPTENADFDPEVPYYYYNKHPSASRMRDLKQIMKQRFVSSGRSKVNTNIVNIPEDLLELKMMPTTPVQSYKQTPASMTSTPSGVTSVTPKMTPTTGVSPMSNNLFAQQKPAMASSPFATAAPASNAFSSSFSLSQPAAPKTGSAPQFGVPPGAPKQSSAVDEDEGSIDEELSTAEMLKKMQQRPNTNQAQSATGSDKDFFGGQKFGVPNLTNASLIKPTPSPAKSLTASGTTFTQGPIRFGVAEDQEEDEEEEEYEEDEEYEDEYGNPTPEEEEKEEQRPAPVKPRPQVPVATQPSGGAIKSSASNTNNLAGSGSFGFGTSGSSFSFGQPASSAPSTSKPSQPSTATPFALNTSGSTASAFNFNAGSAKVAAPAAPKAGDKRKSSSQTQTQLVSNYGNEEEEEEEYEEEEEEGEDSEDSYVETTGPRPGAAPSGGVRTVSSQPRTTDPTPAPSKPLALSGSGFGFGTTDSSKPSTSGNSFGFGAPTTENKPPTTAPSSGTGTSGSSSLGFGSLSSLGANTFSFGDKKPGDSTKPAATTGSSSTFSFGSLGSTPDASKPATTTGTTDNKTSPGTKPTTAPGTGSTSTFSFGAPSTTASTATDTKPAATTTSAATSTTAPSTTAPSTTSTPAATTSTFGFGTSGTSGSTSSFGFGSSGSSSTFGFGAPAATSGDTKPAATTGTTPATGSSTFGFGTPAVTSTPAKPDATKPGEPSTPSTPAGGFGFGFGSSTPSFGFGAQPSTPSTPSTFGTAQPATGTTSSTGGLSFGLSLGGSTNQPPKPAGNPFGGAPTVPSTAVPTTSGNLFGGSTGGSFLTQPTFGSTFNSTPSTPAAQPTTPATTGFGTTPSSGTSPFASFGQSSSLGSVFGQSTSLGISGPSASFGTPSTFGSSPGTGTGFGLGNPQAVQQQIQATTSVNRVFGSGSSNFGSTPGGSPFSQVASTSPGGFGGIQPSSSGFGGFGGAPQQPPQQPPQFGGSSMWEIRK